MSKMVNAKTLTNKEYFYGHKACAGCGGSLAVRLALKVLGDRAFSAIPANCMSSVGMLFPQMAYMGNAIITPFAATAAVMSGMEAGLRRLGVEDFHVVGFAGDGGTADIGFQALSGAIDRNDKIIYICYDNEAYMNTGIQQSGLTPYGSKTTTSPAGENIHGSGNTKKNMFEIVAAHDIPYAATASIGYPQDFLNKLEKASRVEGTSYIHVMAPCPTGWGTAIDETINLAKEAVDCGLWYLAEYEDGEFALNKSPKKFSSLEDYLKSQGRFKHLTGEDISIIENERNRKWQKTIRTWEV
jgi:pyruvate ferredoxin oxidoreductase beta subunit